MTGTNVMSENTIIDLPTGVVTFFMDTNEPRTPGMNNFKNYSMRDKIEDYGKKCTKLKMKRGL